MIQENIALICSMIMCRDENKTEYFSGRQDWMLKKRMQAQPVPGIFQHQSISLGLCASLVTLEGIEGFVGVTNEWQTHLGFL
jgi:hypothetical protein